MEIIGLPDDKSCLFQDMAETRLKGGSLLMIFVIIIGCGVSTRAAEVKPTITAIDSSTGLYFDGIGQLFVHPMQWKIVSYVDLKPIQMLWRQVKTHQLEIVNYCVQIRNTTWYSLTVVPSPHIYRVSQEERT